jgi:hypothetical protein
MYGGEIHTLEPMEPGSWHLWDNKYQSHWESRMGYSAAQQRSDQAKVELSCITHGFVDLSMSSSSDSTTDSTATKGTVYESDDGKFSLRVRQQPAEVDMLDSTNTPPVVQLDAYTGESDGEVEQVAVLGTIPEMEVGA